MKYDELGESSANVLGLLVTLTPGTTIVEINHVRQEFVLHLLDMNQRDAIVAAIQRDFAVHLSLLSGKKIMNLLMLFTVATGISALAGFYRLLAGPTLTDRVIGLDVLFAIAIIFCLIAAWASERTVYLDVAIGLALTGFVATLSWARLIQTRDSSNEEEERL